MRQYKLAKSLEILMYTTTILLFPVKGGHGGQCCLDYR